MAAGSRIRRLRQSHRPRYARIARTSITIRIGSMTAAAWKGLTTIAISGTPTTAMPPPKPPLAMPTMSTATVAAR